MAENVLYADLNLSESTRPRILKVPDVQGCTYAEVKVESQDTNAATNCKSPGKSCRSRRQLAVLVAVLVVIILAVAIVVYGTLLYGPAAGSQQDSTATTPEEALGCPPKWEKHGRKCYFFSPEEKLKDWKASREECAAMSSELVIIDSKEELDFLTERSRHNYYLLGLRYIEREQKWKWINNVEHNAAMFRIDGHFRDYLCVVIGFGKVETAPCGGSQTTQNMCEKAATVSARPQKDG